MVLLHSTAATKECNYEHNHSNDNEDYRSSSVEAFIGKVDIRMGVRFNPNTNNQDDQAG